VSERELAGIAVHQVETDGKNDVDADGDDDTEEIGIEVIGEVGRDKR
jgi:hypothetical protein